VETRDDVEEFAALARPLLHADPVRNTLALTVLGRLRGADEDGGWLISVHAGGVLRGVRRPRWRRRPAPLDDDLGGGHLPVRPRLEPHLGASGRADLAARARERLRLPLQVRRVEVGDLHVAGDGLGPAHHQRSVLAVEPAPPRGQRVRRRHQGRQDHDGDAQQGGGAAAGAAPGAAAGASPGAASAGGSGAGAPR